MAYEGETGYMRGDASGIARSLAARLVSNKGKGFDNRRSYWMKVIIADRNIEGAEEAAKELNKNDQSAWAVQVDVVDCNSQRKGFEAAVNHFDHIDYVFPIAGTTETSWLPNRPNATGFQKPNLPVWKVNGNGVLYTSTLAI